MDGRAKGKSADRHGFAKVQKIILLVAACNLRGEIEKGNGDYKYNCFARSFVGAIVAERNSLARSLARISCSSLQQPPRLRRTREAPEPTATQAAIRRADEILCLHDTVILYRRRRSWPLRRRLMNPLFVF